MEDLKIKLEELSYNITAATSKIGEWWGGDPAVYPNCP